MRILIVEDDRASALLLTAMLQRWGYEVVHASDGQRAWEILHEQDIRLVISDWMMPRVDGPELCRRIRKSGLPGYTYVILLTARGERQAIVEGLGAGADDFVAKPFDQEELHARLRAGMRIVKLESDLEQRNHRLEDAYRSMRQDLEAAATMQRNLLPKPSPLLGGCSFDWLFVPSSFVAGDILDYFPLDPHHVAFYLLDVAGHGVRAAMHSVALSRLLSSSHRRDRGRTGSWPDVLDMGAPSPAEVVRSLNARFETATDAQSYFTMIYGVIDARDGTTRIVQAGHPAPIHQSGSSARLVGTGGYAVGMLPDVEYEELEIRLEQGDRLFVYSDGVVECKNGSAEEFSPGRLLETLCEQRGVPAAQALASLASHLERWSGDQPYRDDMTMLAIERVEGPASAVSAQAR